MSKWLKQFLFGIWGLLLIPLIAPIIEKWLEENVFSDPNGTATTVFRNAVATPVFESCLALGQHGGHRVDGWLDLTGAWVLRIGVTLGRIGL